MATKPKKQVQGRASLAPALEQIAKKLSGYRALREGRIVLRASGPGGGDYHLACSDSGVQLETSAAGASTTMDAQPVFEILGDVRRIQSLLSARTDARAQFLAGGFRIRTKPPSPALRRRRERAWSARAGTRLPPRRLRGGSGHPSRLGR